MLEEGPNGFEGDLSAKKYYRRIKSNRHARFTGISGERYLRTYWRRPEHSLSDQPVATDGLSEGNKLHKELNKPAMDDTRSDPDLTLIVV